MDVFVNLSHSKHVAAQIAWAHFIPGGYIRNQFDERDDADRLYLHLTMGF